MRPGVDHTVVCVVRLSIAAAMVIAIPVYEDVINCVGTLDFCKEVSTKGNENRAVTGQQPGEPVNADPQQNTRRKTKSLSTAGLLNDLKLELAYFSGRAWFKRRGAGVIIQFGRVRPRHAAQFQPSLSSEITPEFL